MRYPLDSGRPTWGEKMGATLYRFPAWIRFAVEGWHERHALARDLAKLRLQGELDRTLADNGISGSEVMRLMRAHPGAARQFAEMTERVGVDRRRLPATPAVGATLRDMEWRCGECRSWRRCRDWLGSGLRNDGYRAFCPNADALEELRDRQQRSAPVQGTEPNTRPGLLAELQAVAGQDL